ncbi:putative short-chain dehydrogenase/reductase [Mycolicibacterium litorale]|uniref:Putative short-chain dehydrogenase/reductase n=1 Tax=Mycolicibacterium litorale TaxID=758802 RepID=A0A6S6PEM1_9MYCO|nr:mycofactocin-coupled SDR family oxidoreductase [Mycolicibacterium litorale]BCI56131.1 putative short-chain dehydrogenase/reductase [Mycolicibacterium litorale]
MTLLDGKVVLITGAARGQGRAHAIVSAQEGADVVLFDTATSIDSIPYPLADEKSLQETAREVEALGRRAITVVGDVRSQADLDGAVQTTLAEFGRIDALVANAGVWSLAPFVEMTDEQWQDMLDVNLTGVFRTVKAVLPHMINRRDGAIVLTASVNSIEPTYFSAHYVASKHGVLGLTRSIALEMGQYGIRCNAIAPGIIDTPMLNWQGAYDLVAGHPGGVPDDLQRAGYRYHVLPQGPMDPTVVGKVAAWLNSDSAGPITGHCVPIEGGHLVMAGQNLANVPAHLQV